MTYAVATETLAAEYAAGLTAIQIARKRHLSRGAVNYRLSIAGIALRDLRQQNEFAHMKTRVHRCATARAILATGPSVGEIMRALRVATEGTT